MDDTVGYKKRTMRLWNVATTLVFLLLVGLFAGCDSNTPPATSQSTSTPLLPTPTLFSFEDKAPPTATPTVQPLSETEAQPVAPTPVPATPLPMTQHIVEPGDTLLALALRYSVPMAAIQSANDLGTSTVVQAGQALSIPPTESWEGASPFWVLYEVVPGDTLLGLKETFDVEVEALRAVNGMTHDTIRVGQTLILPLDGPVTQALDPTATSVIPTATPIPPTATALPPAVTAAPPTSAPTEVPTVAPTSPSAPPPADVAAWPREVARLINEVRAAHGLPPMAYNETLAVAAQGHANDCMQRGWCSHTGSDGAYIKERLERVGYTGAGWAECWAQRLTPQGAIDIWMDEVPPNDPHRRTLLSTWLTEVGVGVAKTDWGYYFIADFGRP